MIVQEEVYDEPITVAWMQQSVQEHCADWGGVARREWAYGWSDTPNARVASTRPFSQSAQGERT